MWSQNLTNEKKKKKKKKKKIKCQLAALALKNNIFEFSDKTDKQIRGTTIGTKFALPYAILFFFFF